jgi:hypothetical protein
MFSSQTFLLCENMDVIILNFDKEINWSNEDYKQMLLIKRNDAQTTFVCINLFSFLTLFSLLPTFLFFPHAYHLPLWRTRWQVSYHLNRIWKTNMECVAMFLGRRVREEWAWKKETFSLVLPLCGLVFKKLCGNNNLCVFMVCGNNWRACMYVYFNWV